MTDTTSHSGRIHARTDVFLLLIARGQADRALALNPFQWKGGRTENGYPFIEITLRRGSESPMVARGVGDDALRALRNAVLEVPALAVRLAKIEAVLADQPTNPALDEVPRLTLHMVTYLAGRARKDLKERERMLERFTPKPGQSHDAIAEAKDKLRQKISFIHQTLHALNSTRDGIARGRRVSDAIHTVELDGLELGELPFTEIVEPKNDEE